MKVVKIAPDEKVVEFSELNAAFNPGMPVTVDIRKMMEEVHKRFTEYMVNEHFDEVQEILKEFIDDHHPNAGKRQALEHNLFWWKLIYESDGNLEWCLGDEFMEEAPDLFADQPLLASWLREWDRAETKFYYVGHKFSDRVFFVIDILENEVKYIKVADPEADLPEQGEIVVGTLVPYGDELYVPLTDFYRFDYGAREAIGANFKYYFNKYLETDGMAVAFLLILSAALKIERRIRLDVRPVK